MVNSVTLPVMAALSLVGAALGVHFGRSAIAEINPVFYDQDEEYFSFASLSPNRPRDTRPSHPADFWESELSVSRASYCPGCDDERVISVDGGYRWPAYSAPADAVDPEPVYVAEAPNPAHAEVDRYAHFQVAAAEAPAEETQLAEAEATEAEPAAEQEEALPTS